MASPIKQKLSPKAAAAKKKRDLAYAKTPRRRKMKAANQKDNKDFDHTTMSWVSVNRNRSGFGKGTKKNNTKNSSRV